MDMGKKFGTVGYCLFLLAGFLSAQGLSVDTFVRSEVVGFHEQEGEGGPRPAMGWTGSYNPAEAGATATAFQEAVLHRVNYYRALAGIPADITLRQEWVKKAQEAAFMMSTNNALSHGPPPDWNNYTAAGAEAAGNSNLALGSSGWDAIDGYMRDPGAGNAAVGHRRWILYPWTQQMVTGDVPPDAGFRRANALWVFDTDNWPSFFNQLPRPETRTEYVAWPPRGFVPHNVVFPRWSFGLEEADFSQASVSMTRNGQSIPVQLEAYAGGFGDDTLVWLYDNEGPNDPPHSAPAGDLDYTVKVEDVQVNGQDRDFTYTVTVIDPSQPASHGNGYLPHYTELGEGWKWNSFLRSYSDLNFPVLYTASHGWWYAGGPGAEADAYWFYDYELGWLYTSEAAYPYCYLASDALWIWFELAANDPRYYREVVSGNWRKVPRS
ncbi:MAG: hypothetical protein GVY10_06565 [Verrucomicrobia bacterium]|jgi:hypothetical protein|nr:hypothetical protein [Verrucomicrobiota bacterium]